MLEKMMKICRKRYNWSEIVIRLNRLCVPANKELKKKLLYEAHNTVFTMYPGGNKMY